MSLLPTVSRSGGDSHPADQPSTYSAIPRDSGDSHPTDDGQEHGAPPVITSASGLGTQRSDIISSLSDAEATSNKFETPPVSASSRETNSELRQLLPGTLKKGSDQRCRVNSIE